MSKETAQFILERPIVAQQVLDALSSLEGDILRALQEALNENLGSLLGPDWRVHPECDLVEDWWFAASHERWNRTDEDDEGVVHLVCPTVWLDGDTDSDDPIWTLLGVPIDHPGSVMVGLEFEGLWKYWSPKNRKALFKERMAPLIQAGFQPFFDGGEASLALPLRISPEAILAGLRDDEWEAALEPIRAGWAMALEYRAPIDALVKEVLER